MNPTFYFHLGNLIQIDTYVDNTDNACSGDDNDVSEHLLIECAHFLKIINKIFHN